MQQTPRSEYYKFDSLDGMEALSATHYHTPFPEHYHDSFNITLVYEGIFQTQLSDRFFPAPTGSILITNPKEIHANPVKKDESISFFTFYINPAFFAHANGKQLLNFGENVIDDPTIFSRLHCLSRQIQQEKCITMDEKRYTATLAMLAKKYGSRQSLKVSSSQLGLFKELIHGNNLEKFSLTDAASKAGIDKYKFLRLFKSQTGLTPNNYVLLKRIEKSKILLAENRDLLSIAVELGFYDAAHYCHHFKRFTGISPKAFTGIS